MVRQEALHVHWGEGREDLRGQEVHHVGQEVLDDPLVAHDGQQELGREVEVQQQDLVDHLVQLVLGDLLVVHQAQGEH